MASTAVTTRQIKDAAVTFTKLATATNPGLEDSTGIKVKADTAKGIVVGADGVGAALQTGGGLKFNSSTGELFLQTAGLPASDAPITVDISGVDPDAPLGYSIGLDHEANSLEINGSDELQVKGFKQLASDPGSPSTSEAWYNTTSNQVKVQDPTVTRALLGLVAARSTPSQTIASTTAETFFNTDQQYVIPANTLKAGRRVRITAWGRYGLDAAGSPTLRWVMNFGGHILVDTGGQNPLTSASLNRNWRITADVYCISDGSSGTVMSCALVSAPTTLVIPGANGASTLNTTNAITIATSVQFSASSATNRAQMLGLLVEIA